MENDIGGCSSGREVHGSGAFEEDEIDLLCYLEVVVRRRWQILLGTAICLALAFGLSHMEAPMYRAEAHVLPSKVRELELREASLDVVPQLEVYTDVLRGPSIGFAMLDHVVRAFVQGRRDSVSLRAYFGGSNTKAALDGLAECSEFRQHPSGVLSIAVTLAEPEVAAAIANGYVEELILYYTDRQQEQTEKDLDFIHSRVEAMESELRKAEDALAAFQRSNVSARDPRTALRLAQLQREVQLKARLYSTLMEQYELKRIQVRRDIQGFQVLNSAKPSEIAPTGIRKRVVLVGASSGFFISVFLAFLLEYFARQRQCGRLEPVLTELRKDAARVRALHPMRLFGKCVRQASSQQSREIHGGNRAVYPP